MPSSLVHSCQEADRISRKIRAELVGQLLFVDETFSSDKGCISVNKKIKTPSGLPFSRQQEFMKEVRKIVILLVSLGP